MRMLLFTNFFLISSYQSSNWQKVGAYVPVCKIRATACTCKTHKAWIRHQNINMHMIKGMYLCACGCLKCLYIFVHIFCLCACTSL